MSKSNNKLGNNSLNKKGWLADHWLDLFKVIGGCIVFIYGAYWADEFKNKLSAVNFLTQREQSETQLRASMFNNLMERIISKEETHKLDPEKMLLLTQLLAFNFHEHFQFKPLLVNLYNESLECKRKVSECSSKSDDTAGKKIKDAENRLLLLESLGRRIIEQQVDALRATAILQKDRYSVTQQTNDKKGKLIFEDIYTSDLFFKNYSQSNKPILPPLSISYSCNYIDKDSFFILKKDIEKLDNEKDKFINSQQNPAFFIDHGPSQCITIVPPEAKYTLDIAVIGADFDNKKVNVSVSVSGQKIRGVQPLYEFEVTPFDFPLTDNTTIDPDHRFAIFQKSIDNETNQIWLRVIWFPKAYITERERPMNYPEMRKWIEATEKQWWQFWR